MREVVSHHIRERHVTFTLELASTRQSAYVALPGIVEIQNTAYSIQHTGAPGFSRNRAQSGMSGIPLFSWQGCVVRVEGGPFGRWYALAATGDFKRGGVKYGAEGRFRPILRRSLSDEWRLVVRRIGSGNGGRAAVAVQKALGVF